MRTIIVPGWMLVAVFVVLGGRVSANVLTWDGDSSYANGVSNVSSNWNAVGVWRPASGSTNVTWNSATPDDGIFTNGGSADPTITNDAPTTVGTLTLDSSANRSFSIAASSSVNSLTVNTLMTMLHGSGVLNFDTVNVTGTGAASVSSGKLRFGNGTNTFSGGVIINPNGWLRLGANSNPTTVGGTILNGPIGTGTLTVNGGQIEANGASYSILNAVRVNGDFSVANGYRLTLNGPTDLGGAVRTITVGPGGSANLFFGGAVSNGAIVKTGMNTLYVSGSASVSNSFTQGLIIQQGTLSLYASGSQAMINALGGKDLTLYEGTLLNGGSALTFGPDNIILYHTGAGSPVVLSLNYGFTLNNVISEANGSATLMLRLDNYTSASTTYTMGGSSPNTYSGMTSLINSNVSANSAIFYLLLDKTSGVDAVPGDLTIGGKDTNNLAIVRYNNGKDNQIRDTATVTVNPFGTFRVADNQATPVGRTETIKALVANNPAGSVQFGSNIIGRLSLGTDQGSGSGLFVNSGGTLSGVGQVTVAPAPMAVNAGGTLSPGSNSIGALQFLATASPLTNVSLNAGSTYKWEVANWSGAAGIGYDVINVTGAVVFASTAANPFTVAVTATSLVNFVKTAPASFPILTATAGISGLTTTNWAITVAGFASGVSPKNFSLSIQNGGSGAQSLILSYADRPKGTAVLFQ